jgi:tRNA-Thr(GGU) m(6)t(6)A37 methyltransferase TsaA
LNDTITFSPIGRVKSDFDQNIPAEQMRSRPSQIVVDPALVPGLMGLAAGDDILVLFSFHRVKPEEVALQLHLRHNLDNPRRGVFATRTQFRPNSIGATVVRLEAVSENILTVSGLDAQDGAPVLDLKPYTPYFDADFQSQQREPREVTDLAEARQAIDTIDAEIVRLLGNRAGYVRQVAGFKQSAADVPAPARYAEVMRRRREMAQEAGLDPDVIEAMYKLLVDYFIKEQLAAFEQSK